MRSISESFVGSLTRGSRTTFWRDEMSDERGLWVLIDTRVPVRLGARGFRQQSDVALVVKSGTVRG